MAIKKEKVPRDPKRPTPPYTKPPRGYRPLYASEMDERLRQASKEELILLLQKGENAGFFRLFEKDDAGQVALAEASDEETSRLEIDEGSGWPPGGTISSLTSGVAKKASKKSAGKGGQKTTGKKAGKTAGGAKGPAAKKGSKSSKR